MWAGLGYPRETPPLRPPAKGLFVGRVCEDLSREGDSVCPGGPGETARRMNGPGEELGPRGDDVP